MNTRNHGKVQVSYGPCPPAEFAGRFTERKKLTEMEETGKQLNKNPVTGVKLLGDHDAEDLLETRPLARSLASLINDSVESLPFAIGIEGSYGSGKTTVLKQIEGELNGKFKTIFFYPWQYTEPIVLQSALMSSFINKILSSSEVYRNLKKIKWKLVSIILSTLSAAIFRVDLSEKIAKSFETNPMFKDEFAETFVPAIEEQLEKNKQNKEDPSPGIIVLVDDVDRCYPKSVLALLECIMLFYNIPKVCFILAYDQMILLRIIKAELEGYVVDPARYMKKFVQIQISVSDYRKRKIDEYIDGCLKKSGLSNYIQSVNHDVIRVGTQDNPREIKSLLNTIVMDITESDISKQDIKTVVIFRLLELRWPLVYRRLILDEKFCRNVFDAKTDGNEELRVLAIKEILTDKELADDLIKFLNTSMCSWSSKDFINNFENLSSSLSTPLTPPSDIYRDVKNSMEHKALGLLTKNSAVPSEDRSVGIDSGKKRPTWVWSIWIEPLALSSSSYQNIEKVVYHLHHTFQDPDRERKNKDENFLLEAKGWGTFQIRIELFDQKDEGLGTIYHDLRF